MKDLGEEQVKSIMIACYNKYAISIVENPVHHEGLNT